MERLERLVHELDQCGRIILLLIVEEEEETMDVEDTEKVVYEVDNREANLKEEEEVDSKISHHHQGEIFLGEVLMAMRKDLSLR